MTQNINTTHSTPINIALSQEQIKDNAEVANLIIRFVAMRKDPTVDRANVNEAFRRLPRTIQETLRNIGTERGRSYQIQELIGRINEGQSFD